MFVVKEYNLIAECYQYLKSFNTFGEAKDFADDWHNPTKIYEILYDGQVEHGPL